MLVDDMVNYKPIKCIADLIEEPQHGIPFGDGENYKWIESMVMVLQIMLE